MKSFSGTERFELRRCLGAGAFGTVYEAYDRERDRVVALKSLKDDEPEALYRFKQEFRALADIYHPNLVTLYELLCEGRHWFFTMELVEGRDFISYVRQGAAYDSTKTPASALAPDVHPGASHDSNVPPVAAYAPQLSTLPFDTTAKLETPTPVLPPPETDAARDLTRTEEDPPAAPPDRTQPAAGLLEVNLARLRWVLFQLAEAVLALHQADKLHRDLKPANVLVTPEGRVVVLDFGLVHDLNLQRLKQSTGESRVGTPAYMSPEQCAGQPVSPASDWYSVGTMLYEALTGDLPFRGGWAEQMLAKLRRDPVPISSLRKDIPDDLRALCHRLLDRNPAARPAGHEVRQKLQLQPRSPRDIPSPTKPPRTFVGRKQTLEVLHEAYRDMRAGRSVLVKVRGQSGMGKTALVRHFLESLTEKEDVVVLAGRCFEQESVPYKALDAVIDALSRYLTRLESAAVRALVPRDVVDLVRLFPALGHLEGVAGTRRFPSGAQASQELRRRGFAGLHELLSRLADRVPLVVVIDDLQWGDVDSGAFLEEMLIRNDPPALLLILSYRIEAEHETALLSSLIPKTSSPDFSPKRFDISLEELSRLESTDLARLLLGEDYAPEEAEWVARESDGSPIFIHELIRYEQERRQQGPETTRALEAHPALHDVIVSRVTGLPEDARRLLEVIAVAGQAVEQGLAKRAAGLEARDEAALTLLRTNFLIRTHGRRERDKVEVHHDRIRETLVARLSADALREHHHRLAEEWLVSGRADPETLAQHFLAAGERVSAARYAAEAAAQAAKALAFDRAARLYRLALQLHPDPRSPDIDLQVKLAEALVNARRGPEAAEVFREVAVIAPVTTALELKRRAAELLLTNGHIDDGLATLADVMQEMGMRLPPTPFRALLSFLVRRTLIWIRGLRFRERGSEGLPADRLMRMDICWSVALGLPWVDTVRGYDFQARYVLQALSVGEPVRMMRALLLEVAFGASLNNRTRRRAARLSQQASALAERLDDAHTRGRAKLAAVMYFFFDGQFRKATDLARHGEALLREQCVGVAFERNMFQFYSLLSLCYMGEWREIAERLPPLLRDLEQRGDLFGFTNLRIRIGYVVSLLTDEPDKARREVEAATAQWSRQGFHVQHFWNLYVQGEIDMYSGRAPEAWERVSQTWGALARSFLLQSQGMYIEALYLRGRAALAAAVSQNAPRALGPLLRRAEKDARKIARERVRWANPLANLLKASVAATRGNLEEALARMALAEAGFEAADMGLHLEVARLRRGQLLGEESGARLIENAEKAMTGQGIVCPARVAAMLAPGTFADS